MERFNRPSAWIRTRLKTKAKKGRKKERQKRETELEGEKERGEVETRFPYLIIMQCSASFW
jgi:hypothetical protein